MTKKEKIKIVQGIINREKLNAEKVYVICMYSCVLSNYSTRTNLSPEEHTLVKDCFTRYPANLFKLY